MTATMIGPTQLFVDC